MEFVALLLAAMLLLMLAMVYSVGMLAQVGIGRMLGNRAGFPDVGGWPERGKRAHLNLLENLLPFAIVVLMAAAMGQSTPLSEVGAVIFISARIVHALSYILGVTIVRTIAHHTGTLGTLLVASVFAL